MARQKRQFARQGAASDLPDRAAIRAYVGPPAEPIWDGERLRMHDGTTPGGVPLVRCGRRAIADANASLAAADSYTAVTSLTASRTISLPPAANYEPGQPLYIAAETDQVSFDVPLIISASGSDQIIGFGVKSSSVTMTSPSKFTFHSNGSNLWTVC
jgi:hypothetical protein